jgi:hypothetical protein
MPNQKKNAPKAKRRPPAVSFSRDLEAGGRLVSRALAVFKGATSLLLNAEFKHIDTTVAAAVSTTPALSVLCAVGQGDTNITRDGNSLKCVGFEFRYLWGMNASATASLARVVVLLDTRNVGAAPTATDVYASSVLALPNIDAQPNRFVTLFDKVTSLVLVGDSRQSVTGIVSLDILKGVHFTFNGNAATVADLRGAALFLYVLSNEATNTPSIDFQSRLLFVDN